ncbi:WEB family protein At5g16730, chloroplastic-like isoform X2 [Trichogramma pretiosum]|uniref:WEB family protein At5g16730, chloroplastic-like isoform X2 n=1 Tax=Trichogramma pretiosum TaxID=7493 RepID=UPI0006C9C897|nr:WEB family protein At5g16730, chloroplastic-like isoform X2 [Trichogramma pretiosum]
MMDNEVDVICISSSDDEEFSKTPPTVSKNSRNNKRKNSSEDSKIDVKKFKSSPKTSPVFCGIFNKKNESTKNKPSTSSAPRKLSTSDKNPISNVNEDKTGKNKKSQEPLEKSSLAKNVPNETPKETVTKVKPTLVVKNKIDITNSGEEIFAKFLEVCKENCIDTDINKCIEQLKKPFNKLSHEETNNQELKLFMSNKIQKMCKISSDESKTVFKHMLDVKEELNLRLKQSKIERKSNEDDSDQNNDISPGLQQKIDLIKKKMQQCRDRIKQLEEEEVDFDDEDNSAYIKEDRYKKKLIELAKVLAKYEKNTELEKNLNQKMRLSKEKIKSEMSGISVVDDEIIKFYNRRISKINKFKHIENVNANPDFFETPDFLDVKNVVVKCNTTYNLKLSSTKIDNMACQSFKAVSHYLQKCRTKESRVFFDSIAQEFGDNEDPAKGNQELECTLKKNKEEGDKKLSEIFKLYEDKQNGLSKEELEQMQQDTGDSNSDSEEEPQNYKKLKLDDFENDHCRKQEKQKNNYKELIDSDSEKEFVSKEKINYRKKEKQKVKEIHEVTLIDTDSEGEEPAKIEKNKSNKQYKQKKETSKNKVTDSDSEEEPVSIEKKNYKKQDKTNKTKLIDSDSEEEPVSIDKKNYKKQGKHRKDKTNKEKVIDSDSEDKYIRIEEVDSKKHEKQEKEKIIEVEVIDSDSDEEPVRCKEYNYEELDESFRSQLVDSDSKEEGVAIKKDSNKKQEKMDTSHLIDSDVEQASVRRENNNLQNQDKSDESESIDSDNEDEPIKAREDNNEKHDKTNVSQLIDSNSKEEPVRIKDDNCKNQEQKKVKIDEKKIDDSVSEENLIGNEDNYLEKQEKTIENKLIDLESEEDTVSKEESNYQNKDKTDKSGSIDSENEEELDKIKEDNCKKQNKTDENKSFDSDSVENPVRIEDDSCKNQEQEKEKIDEKKINDSTSIEDPIRIGNDHHKKQDETTENKSIDCDGEEKLVRIDNEINKKIDITIERQLINSDNEEEPVDEKNKLSEEEECSQNPKNGEEESCQQSELINEVEEETSINKLSSIANSNNVLTKTNDGNQLENIELNNKENSPHYQSCNIPNPSSNVEDNISEKIVELVRKTAIENDEPATSVGNSVESEIVKDSKNKTRIENQNMNKENLEKNCMKNSTEKTDSADKDSDEPAKKQIEEKNSEKYSEEQNIDNKSTKQNSTETSPKEEISPIKKVEETPPPKPLLKVKPFGCMPTTWSDSPIVPTSVPSNDTDDSVIILDDSVVILDDSDATPTPPRRQPPPTPKITIKPKNQMNNYRPAGYISNNTTPRRPHQQTRCQAQPFQPGSTRQSTQHGRQRNNHNYREHGARYNNSGRPYHNKPFRK